MSSSKRNPSSAPIPAAATVPARWRSQAGFSLAELIVSLFVVVLMLVMILLIFDSTSKLARAQTYVADLQQSVRFAQDEMVRYTRMAARGGLGRGNLPAGLVTVDVRNNVVDGSAEQDIGIGTPGSPKVMPDTDVLTVRGVFGSMFHLNSDPGAVTFTLDDPDNPTRGTVVVENPVQSTGIAQSLQPLIAAVDPPDATPPRHEALLLVSPLGGALYHVVELDPDNSDVTNPSRITLAFTITGGARNADYSAISGAPAFPPELRSVSHLGIVEEYRYYVRQILDPADPGAEPQTRLSRARFYPGTQDPYDGEPSMRVDVADNIVDLQVALAIDTTNPADNAIGPDTADENDEWLYNAAGDDPNDIATWNGPTRKLFYVRINTLARAARRDFQYVDQPIVRIEDHAYGPTGTGEPAVPGPTEVAARQMRRRLLQTVIDLRNL